MKKSFSTLVFALIAISGLSANYNEFTTKEEVTEVTDKIETRPIISAGGWRNPVYYTLTATPGPSTTGSTTYEVRSGDSQVQGDTYRKYQIQDSYTPVYLGINIERREEGYGYPEGVWSLDSVIPEGSATLSNDVVLATGVKSVFTARFTDTEGKSRTIQGEITGFANRTNIISDLSNDVVGSWRRAYTKNVLDHYDAIDWSSNLQYYLGCIDHTPINSSRMRWPKAINLWENYQAKVGYSTGALGNIGWGKGTFLAKLCVTNFVPGLGGDGEGPFPIESSSTHYTNSIISFARVPTAHNRSFFWPELQEAMRCVAAHRGEWYADLPFVLVSPHYAICATHTVKNQNYRFCTSLENNTFANVIPYGGKNIKQNEIKIYGDVSLIRLADNNGLPANQPVAKFLGTYGNENYSSLYHLSKSFGDRIPALSLTQHATVHPVLIKITNGNSIDQSYADSLYTTAGYTVDLSKWSDPAQTTNQYDTIVNGKWSRIKNQVNGIDKVPLPGLSYSCDYSWMNGQIDYYWRDYCPGMAMDDPNNNPYRGIIEPNYNDNTFTFKIHTDAHIPKGHHYVAHGFDSGYPIGLFINGHYILVGEYWYSAGGNCLLDPVLQDVIDQVMAQDSLKYFGVEEHLTKVNCCDLDPEHTYHVH